jgi:hypothetical protein
MRNFSFMFYSILSAVTFNFFKLLNEFFNSVASSRKVIILPLDQQWLPVMVRLILSEIEFENRDNLNF